jgi:hypothetical protein
MPQQVAQTLPSGVEAKLQYVRELPVHLITLLPQDEPGKARVGLQQWNK